MRTVSNGEGLQDVSETCYDDGGTDKKDRRQS